MVCHYLVVFHLIAIPILVVWVGLEKKDYAWMWEKLWHGTYWARLEMLSGDCRRKGNCFCKVCMARFRVQFLLADQEFPLNFSRKKYPAKYGKRFATLKSSFQTESNICYIVCSCLNLDFTGLGYYDRYMLMGLNAMIMMQPNWIFIQRPGTQSNLNFSNYRRSPVQDAESQCKIKKKNDVKIHHPCSQQAVLQIFATINPYL